MTVVFCDLAGSSALSARLDPEDFAALLVAYRERCARAVLQHGGYVSRYVGDGVLACFGYPRAVGRDAQSAVACGLAIAGEISALARDTSLPGGADLAVRVGIETGLVLAGRLGPGTATELDALVGSAPNTAARLQQLAPSNRVVIGEAAHELVSADFRCEELHHQINLTPPTRAYVVCGEAAWEGRPLRLGRRRGPLIGRVAELAELQRRWQGAVAGEGQTVLLSGEPGMGKSRLAQELLDRIGDTPHAFMLLACTPTGTATALHAAVEALRRTLQSAVEISHGSLTLLQALGNLALQAGLGNGTVLEVLAEAVGIGAGPDGLEPVVRRRLLLEAMQIWLLHQSDPGPLLILVEDLHWSDPTLIELLNGLAVIVPSRRAMLLVTYRSDFALQWQDRPATTCMALQPLSMPDCHRLIDVLAGNLSSATRDTILARSDGIPLFLEEFALTAGTPTIPRTLQQLFTARLDALGHAKRLAQCAAVLGRELEADVLAALAGLPLQRVEDYLSQLVDAEMLLPVTLAPAATYNFRHALLQQAISELVLLTDRRALHSRAAALLPKLRPALVERQPEIVAEHHEFSGRVGRGIALLHRRSTPSAGKRCITRNGDAHLPRTGGGDVDAIGRRPGTGTRAAPSSRPGAYREARYASATVQEAFELALGVAELVQEETRVLAPLRGLVSFYQVRGPLSRAETICNRLVVAAERSNDPCGLVDAWRRRGWNRGCMGRLAEAEEDLSERWPSSIRPD